MAVNRLEKRLADIVVIVGGDEHSGLAPLSQNMSQNLEENIVSYRPNILGVITESVASYPFHLLQVDPLYPGNEYQIRSKLLETQVSIDEDDEVKYSSLHQVRRTTNFWSCSRLTQQSSMHLTVERRMPITKSIAGKRRQTDSLAIAATSGSTIKSETIEGLPSLIYPHGISVVTQENKPMTTVEYYILTNIKGEHLYALCLKIYRKFQSTTDIIDKSLTLRRFDEDVEMDESLLSGVIFVPTTIIVVSEHPYFNALKLALSAFTTSLNLAPSQFQDILSQFAAQIINTPVPSFGSACLQVQILNTQITIQPPLQPINRVVDFDLTILFRFLFIDDIIYLVISLLLQRRVVIASSKNLLASLACEALLILIQPFEWRFTYVPFLPATLLDVFDAPGPFLLGCHAHHLDILNQTEDIVVVNLDESCIRKLENTASIYPSMESVFQLKQSLEIIEKNYDTFLVDKCEASNFEESLHMRQTFDFINIEYISNAFFEFFVVIFNNVDKYIHRSSSDKNDISFNDESFLNSQSIETQAFYKEVLKTDSFDLFLRRHINRSLENWKHIEDKINKRSEVLSPTFDEYFQNALNDRLIIKLSDEETNDATSESETNYFDRIIGALTHLLLDDSLDMMTRSTCLSIRSDLNMAINHKVLALRDLHQIIQIDVKLIDKKKVGQILEQLSPAELYECETKSFFPNLKEIINYRRQSSNSDNDQPTIQRKIKLPNEPINNILFCDLVQKSCITSDREIQEAMFSFFTLDQNAPLLFRFSDPQRMIIFYHFWKELAGNIDLDMYGGVLQPSEIILKIGTNSIRIDPIGTGYILVTQERLLFISMGGDRPRHLVWLRDVRNIKKLNVSGGLFRQNSNTLVLEPVVDKVVPVVLWLKQEIDIWYVLLTEIWAAQQMASRIKNPTIINKGVDNFLILDTIYASSLAEPYFGKNIKLAADCLAWCTAMHKSNFELSGPTLAHLISKYDPDPTTEKTFECFVFVPLVKSVSTKSQFLSKSTIGSQMGVAGSLGGHLWCICSVPNESRLLVIETKEFSIENTVLATSTKLNCMVYTKWKNRHLIWVGAANRKIYLVELAQISVSQELVGHKDSIHQIISIDDDRFVVSGSIEGEMILWNSENRQILKRWNLPDQNLGIQSLDYSSHHNLICNSGKAILIYDIQSGSLVTRFATEGSVACSCVIGDFLYLACARQPRLLVYNISSGPPSLVQAADLDTNLPTCHSERFCMICKNSSSQAHDTGKHNSHKCKCSNCKKEPCRGLSQLLVVSDQIWACCKNGNIYVYHPAINQVLYRLQGHTDAIQAAALTTDQPLTESHHPVITIFTGGRIDDGKICVWNSM